MIIYVKYFYFVNKKFLFMSPKENLPAPCLLPFTLWVQITYILYKRTHSLWCRFRLRRCAHSLSLVQIPLTKMRALTGDLLNRRLCIFSLGLNLLNRRICIFSLGLNLLNRRPRTLNKRDKYVSAPILFRSFFTGLA